MRSLCLAALIAFGTSPAVAQDWDVFTPDQADGMLQLALENIQLADCGGGPASCSPATAEEFANPPISREHAQEAANAGARSAMMEWCGLDWAGRSFLPAAEAFRSEGHPDRAVALYALVHGIAHGQVQREIDASGALCSDVLRDRIDATVPR